MSVLYTCSCGHTQREPADRPAPHCRARIHLREPRATYPMMRAVVELPVEHLAITREALSAYVDAQDSAGEHGVSDAAAAALESLPAP
ncbi:MAG: hypothetical protein LC798_12320 [Chloroflexi bacterium]|nr:hypothetical protein [Chloroflexota bacterium]